MLGKPDIHLKFTKNINIYDQIDHVLDSASSGRADLSEKIMLTKNLVLVTVDQQTRLYAEFVYVSGSTSEKKWACLKTSASSLYIEPEEGCHGTE